MKTFLICLFVPLIGVFFLNYQLDAGNLRATQSTMTLGVEQSGDQLIAAPDQLDHRTWLKARLSTLKGSCPRVLLVGSSTISTYSSDMFGGNPIFNAFLAGPSIEDLEALTALLRQASCWPAAFVIGADPWWVGNPASQSRRWVTWVDDYLDFDGRDRPSAYAIRADLFWSQFEERLNFATTRESLSLFFRNRKGNETRLIEPSGLGDFCEHSALVGYYVRASDGHAIDCVKLLATPEQREQLAESYVQSNPHAMGEWREIDLARIAELRRVVSEWMKHGARAIILAPPYHPTTYAKLMQHPRIGPNLHGLDAALSSLVDGSIYLNLRDPSLAGCSADEFLDSHHPALPCARKVAIRVVASLP